MKKNTLLIIILLAIVATSCSVNKSMTTKKLDIYGAGVIHKPVIVDLDVKEEKVTGTAKGSSTQLEEIKNNAMADAIEKSKADILVEPTFKTVTENSKTTVTVMGFPAKYKNFRSIQKEDLRLLRAGITQKPVKKESKVLKKSNVGAILLGTLGALVIISLLLKH